MIGVDSRLAQPQAVNLHCSKLRQRIRAKEEKSEFLTEKRPPQPHHSSQQPYQVGKGSPVFRICLPLTAAPVEELIT